MKHVKVNGVWYRLAEDAEGVHYQLTLQPLRAPNSQLVQGDTGEFQIRPDVLLWSWTDWSEGEGQINVEQREPGRSRILQGVEPFQKPGTLTTGHKATVVNDSGGSPMSGGYSLVSAYDTLWAIATSGISAYPWNPATDEFDPGEGMTGVSQVDPNSCVGDSDYLFVHDRGTNEIRRRTDAGVWSLHNDQCTLTGEVIMTEMGPYVYIWVPETGTVYEISKETANTTTAEVPITYVNASNYVNSDQALMVQGDGRVYLAQHDATRTRMHEITPSSAAGTGFGNELAVINGVTPEAVWYAAGTLFMMAHDRTPDGTVGSDRQIFYIDPGGSYGTLGSVRGFTDTNGPSALYAVPAQGRLAMSAFALPATNEANDTDDVRMNLFEVDQVTGGFAATGGDDGTLATTSQPISCVYFQGAYYLSTNSALIRWNVQTRSVAETGIAESPANTFGLTGEKILESITVICDPLPSGSSIDVGYSIDGAAWVDATAVSVAGSSEGTLTISTDTSTKQFNSLEVRVKLNGSGSSAPTVRAVDVYASVNRRVKVWDLMLDCTDDAAPQGYNGAQIIRNIMDISENTVIDFVDNYLTHDHTYNGDQYDVKMDGASLTVTQPGEGIVSLRLIERY